MSQISDYMFMFSLLLLIVTVFTRGFGRRSSPFHGDAANAAASVHETQLLQEHRPQDVYRQQDKALHSVSGKSILRSFLFWLSLAGIASSIVLTLV